MALEAFCGCFIIEIAEEKLEIFYSVGIVKLELYFIAILSSCDKTFCKNFFYPRYILILILQ